MNDERLDKILAFDLQSPVPFNMHSYYLINEFNYWSSGSRWKLEVSSCLVVQTSLYFPIFQQKLSITSTTPYLFINSLQLRYASLESVYLDEFLWARRVARGSSTLRHRSTTSCYKTRPLNDDRKSFISSNPRLTSSPSAAHPPNRSPKPHSPTIDYTQRSPYTYAGPKHPAGLA